MAGVRARRERRRQFVFLEEDEGCIWRIREGMGFGTVHEVMRFSLRVADMALGLRGEMSSGPGLDLVRGLLEVSRRG